MASAAKPDVDMVEEAEPELEGHSPGEEDESSEDDYVCPENTCPACEQEFGKQDADS